MQVKNAKDFFRNIYFVLVARLAFSMLLFSLCRVIFYLLNSDLYPDMTFSHFLYLMAAGLRFDLTAVSMYKSLQT